MRLRAWSNLEDVARDLESKVTGKRRRFKKKKKRRVGTYSGKSRKGYTSQLEEADDY